MKRARERKTLMTRLSYILVEKFPSQFVEYCPLQEFGSLQPSFDSTVVVPLYFLMFCIVLFL